MASPYTPSAKAHPTTSVSHPPGASSSSSPPPLPAPPPPPRDDPDPAAPDTIPPLHRAAQQGDLDAVYALLDHPSPHQHPVALTACDPDPQGITPLHWAAINGHLWVARALLDRGAPVDPRGGDLDATPAMWAARNGHLALVHLLLRHGADPCLADRQGFNLLHLAVHSSAAFLLAYLLLAPTPTLDVDAPDPEGHTPLAWACYQGDALSVELLLAAGAHPAATDAQGLTPLHWAVTKGNSACIRRIAQAPGVDLHARTADPDHRTARELSLELKSFPAYARALADAGLDHSGRPLDRPLGERNTRRAIFALVALALGLALQLAVRAPWYVALLAVPAVAFALHHLVVRVLLGVGSGSGSGDASSAAAAAGTGAGASTKPAAGHHHSSGSGGGERVTKSPYLCAIIVGSLFWVAWVWITRFVSLPGYAQSNLLFTLLLGSCSYALYRAVTLDPGTVRGPAIGSDGLKEVVEQLVDAGSFNGMNFCLSCLVRRPLRSKHSYATERCVARFDHYCPWVWNDVGVNNHRHFLVFLISLVGGVVAFLHLTYSYFYERAPDLPPTASCPALTPTSLCMALHYDPFPITVAFWAGLQLTWTVILLGAQLYQIARQLTTLEQSNLGRYGYMGGKPGVSAPHQQGAVEKYTAAQQQARHAAQLVDGGAGDGDDDPTSWAHAPSTTYGGVSSEAGEGAARRSSSSSTPAAAARRPRGRMALLLRLLGLDRFLLSSASSSSASRSRSSSSRATTTTTTSGANPFDLGVWANCVDFWTQGGELGVRYDELWGIPEEGFARVVAERKRRQASRGPGTWVAKMRGRAQREVEALRGLGAVAAAAAAAAGASGAAGAGAGLARSGAGYERVALEEV